MHLMYKSNTLPLSVRVLNGNRHLHKTTLNHLNFKLFSWLIHILFSTHHVKQNSKIWPHFRFNKHDFSSFLALTICVAGSPQSPPLQTFDIFLLFFGASCRNICVVDGTGSLPLVTDKIVAGMWHRRPVLFLTPRGS
jgi:hypothetical protein